MNPKLIEKAKALYEQYKPYLQKWRGKYVAIDPVSGDYFIGNTPADAIRAARQKYPTREFWVVKIGYDYARKFGIIAAWTKNGIFVEGEVIGKCDSTRISLLMDTGFDGGLALPEEIFVKIGADLAGALDVLLADGSIRTLNFYTVTLKLAEFTHECDALLLGITPLLGMEVLKNYEIKMNAVTKEVVLNPISARMLRFLVEKTAAPSAPSAAALSLTSSQPRAQLGKSASSHGQSFRSSCLRRIS